MYAWGLPNYKGATYPSPGSQSRFPKTSALLWVCCHGRDLGVERECVHGIFSAGIIEASARRLWTQVGVTHGSVDISSSALETRALLGAPGTLLYKFTRLPFQHHQQPPPRYFLWTGRLSLSGTMLYLAQSEMNIPSLCCHIFQTTENKHQIYDEELFLCVTETIIHNNLTVCVCVCVAEANHIRRPRCA